MARFAIAGPARAQLDQETGGMTPRNRRLSEEGSCVCPKVRGSRKGPAPGPQRARGELGGVRGKRKGPRQSPIGHERVKHGCEL
jgi:hypothetical protein